MTAGTHSAGTASPVLGSTESYASALKSAASTTEASCGNDSFTAAILPSSWITIDARTASFSFVILAFKCVVATTTGRFDGLCNSGATMYPWPRSVPAYSQNV